MQKYELIMNIITITIVLVLLYFKLRPKKKQEFLSKEWDKYQVQVYDKEHRMLYTGIHEGFTTDEAIKDCKSKFQIPKFARYPIKFFTLI